MSDWLLPHRYECEVENLESENDKTSDEIKS